MSPPDHAVPGPPDLNLILRKGFDDYQELVNPLVALRAKLTGEPYHVVGARDGRMIDAEGREIEDFHGTQSLGHRHPAITAAVQAFLESDHINWYPGRVNPYAGRLARRLCERTGYSNAFFAMSGTEGVEAALKLARAATGRRRILGLAGAYHGCTFGSVALMSPGVFRDPFGPHIPGIESLPWADSAALQHALEAGDVAAVVVEPIQLEGGVRELPGAYVDTLCELTQRHGALLIADEVQTGLGRTGYLLLTGTWPRRPDAVILAKALGGGLVPCSALLSSRALYDAAYGHGFNVAEAHNNTFGGSALSSVAALAMLDQLTEPLMARSLELGDRFRHRLSDALSGSPLVAEVRGRGLIVGIAMRDFDHPWLSFEYMGLPELAGQPPIGHLLCHRLYRRGFYCFVCGHDWRTLRIQPRLDIEEARLLSFVEAVREEVAFLSDLA